LCFLNFINPSNSLNNFEQTVLILNARLLKSFVPALVWVAVITILCLMPGDDLPGRGLFGIPHFDKIAHAGLYFILAILLVTPLKSAGLPVIPVIMAFSLLLGGGMELLQDYFTTSRSGSWFDLIADLTGAFSGLVIFPFFTAKTQRR
jgi:VanZ family protein